MTKLLLHADKECRKLQTGEVSFSPEVSVAAETWRMWKMALEVEEGNIRCKRELVRFSLKLNVEVGDLKNF